MDRIPWIAGFWVAEAVVSTLVSRWVSVVPAWAIWLVAGAASLIVGILWFRSEAAKIARAKPAERRARLGRLHWLLLVQCVSVAAPIGIAVYGNGAEAKRRLHEAGRIIESLPIQERFYRSIPANADIIVRGFKIDKEVGAWFGVGDRDGNRYTVLVTELEKQGTSYTARFGVTGHDSHNNKTHGFAPSRIPIKAGEVSLPIAVGANLFFVFIDSVDIDFATVSVAMARDKYRGPGILAEDFPPIAMCEPDRGAASTSSANAGAAR